MSSCEDPEGKDAATTPPAEPVGITGETTGQPLTGRAKSNANLRPWKPGQSGNPSGLKPGFTRMSDILRRELEKLDATAGEPYNVLLGRAMVRGAIAAALRGSDSLARLVIERVEGKMPELIDLRALYVAMNKPIEQMTDDELEEYDRELRGMIAKYAPNGLPELLPAPPAEGEDADDH